jgi:hypothetical protein
VFNELDGYENSNEEELLPDTLAGENGNSGENNMVGKEKAGTRCWLYIGIAALALIIACFTRLRKKSQ